MRVALVSLDQLWEDKAGNERKVEDSLNRLVNEDVSWVIYPEMTLTGFTMNIIDCAEDISKSTSIQFFSKKAIFYNKYISFGIILKSGIKATNNLITVSPKGEIIANYAKIHPFSFAKENEFYERGKYLSYGTISGITIGFSICYDLRFPELFQALSKSSQLIVNIANWPEKRGSHWQVLIRARAIENQVFFIAVNRTGTDGNGLNYEKSSVVINPEGENVMEEVINEIISVYTIDSDMVDSYRQSFPVKQDRQIELYKEII